MPANMDVMFEDFARYTARELRRVASHELHRMDRDDLYTYIQELIRRLPDEETKPRS